MFCILKILQYQKRLLLFSFILSFFTISVFAQKPKKLEWQKTIKQIRNNAQNSKNLLYSDRIFRGDTVYEVPQNQNLASIETLLNDIDYLSQKLPIGIDTQTCFIAKENFKEIRSYNKVALNNLYLAKYYHTQLSYYNYYIPIPQPLFKPSISECLQFIISKSEEILNFCHP